MTAVLDDAIPGAPPRPGPATFPVPDLDAQRAAFEQLAAVVDEASSDAELVDRMAALVAVRNSVDAALTTTEYSFARVHAARKISVGQIEPEQLERSIATMIGLANRVSPTVGRNRMRVARDLHDGLTGVRSLYRAGLLDHQRITIIAKATAHLDGTERAELDRRLAEEDLPGLAVGRLRDLVARLVAEIAPDTFRDRCSKARTERHVRIRQAPDGMVDLTAHLPVEQGVACYAALHKAYNHAQVSPEPLTRGRGQVMADTLVERVTGQSTAQHVNVEVQVMVPLEALLDPDSPLPGEIAGHGPVPVSLLNRTRGRKMLRRLITKTGIVIGGDSQSRCFPTALGDLIRARDRGRCTEPYCDAPARQGDHIIRAADGGLTTLEDGRAVCQFHNLLREQSGWWVEPTPDGTRTTTPTGHTYDSSPIPRHPAAGTTFPFVQSRPRPSPYGSEP